MVSNEIPKSINEETREVLNNILKLAEWNKNEYCCSECGELSEQDEGWNAATDVITHHINNILKR